MNNDELRRAHEAAMDAAERSTNRAIERANAPTFGEEVLGQIAERVDAQHAADHEAERVAALARLLPIWEASVESIAANEAAEDEEARVARLAADPSSWTALLNRNRQTGIE
jgi:hypothetical protein